MEIKGLRWAAGPMLLLLLAALATSEACRQIKYTYDEPKCEPGENMIFEIRYPEGTKQEGQRSGWCCPPGDDGEKGIMAKTIECRTTKCVKPGKEDACGATLSMSADYWVQGEKIIYEEVKRESCTKENGKPGEVTYCCRKGTLESSLATLIAAEPNELPHMALLSFGSRERCAGTIYNKRYIITAAHCVVDVHGTKLTRPLEPDWVVQLGRNLAKAPMPENDYKIVKTIPHPGFSTMKGNPEADTPIPQAYNDIAFLELDRDITFGPNVKSLQIAPKGFDESKSGQKVVIAGWGTTDTTLMTENLQKANALLRDDEVCFAKGRGAPFPQQSNRMDMLMCVGGIAEGIWSPGDGEGDSGGPAICRGIDGFPLLCGVVSGGGSMEECIKSNDNKECIPTVYTEVDFFVDWIKETAGEQDPSTFYKPQLYGEVVTGSKFDHQVRITSASGTSCGGTLIAPDTVVTAAHCIVSGDGSGKMLSGLQVWSEVRDISSPASQGLSHSIKGVTTLDGFKMVGAPVDIAAQGTRVSETDNFFSNNLGVIKLKDSVNVSPSNLPKLPEGGESAASPAQEYAFPRNTSRGGELRQREYTILDKNECQRRVDRLEYAKMASKVEDNILCGVEKYSGSSICDRELGGGLLCKGKNGKDTLCGVQVHRYCEWSIPNYFIDVGVNSAWIEAAKNQL